MQIVIEINNPHYAAALEDMAQTAGLDAQTLCVGLIEKQLTDYGREVEEAKVSAAAWRLPQRLSRLMLEEEENDA